MGQVRIKCFLCGRKRIAYLGEHVLQYGSHFRLELHYKDIHYKCTLLCVQCVDTIMGVAFDKAKEICHEH